MDCIHTAVVVDLVVEELAESIPHLKNELETVTLNVSIFNGAIVPAAHELHAIGGVVSGATCPMKGVLGLSCEEGLLDAELEYVMLSESHELHSIIY